MPYSEFSLEKVKSKFNLELIEIRDLFQDLLPVEVPPFLTQILDRSLPLATNINTEKSRSGFLIAPILLEVKYLTDNATLFSGIDFNVKPELGLTGFVDFIFSRSGEQLLLESPAIVVVEAKNESIKAGLGQVIAEMYAARLFNNDDKEILGVVTTGEVWKFLILVDQQVNIDLRNYYLNELGFIIAIFLHYL